MAEWRKIVALLTRTAPRDLYDIHNMVKNCLFDEAEAVMLRKCAVYYSAIGAEMAPVEFELNNIDNVTSQQIKRDLDPVLRKGERFNLEKVQTETKNYMASVLVVTEEEKMFWKDFSEKKYNPELIFGKSPELQNIQNHPMALWKCKK